MNTEGINTQAINIAETKHVSASDAAQKTISSKKWVIGTISFSLVILVLMTIFVYLYDPFCFYRIPQNRFIVNNYRFINPGIAKNANYDTVIIGSSMTQNFNMESFRNMLGLNSIKLSVGGMSIKGTDLTYSQLVRIGKAKNVVFSIDLPSLNKEEDTLESYATYLYDDTIINDYQYLLGYETWMRLLPLSLGFNFFDKMGVDIPQFYGTKNLDTIGEWHADAVYGFKILKNDYLEQANQVSTQNLEGISKRMLENSDALLDSIFQKSEKQNIIFFFPPYSALYWYDAKQKGYMDTLQEIKKYIVNELEGKENVTIYDFQRLPIITDLDNYKDTTHYSAYINDVIVDAMAEGNYIVDSDNIGESIKELECLVETFAKENADWLR